MKTETYELLVNRKVCCLAFSFFLMSLWGMHAMALNPTETKYPHKVVTVAFLYEACSSVGETANGKMRFFDCESYVYGVLDAYLAVKSSIPFNLRTCFPPAIPPWQVLEEVRPLVLTYDLVADSVIAGTAIIQALRIKYPCKEKV